MSGLMTEDKLVQETVAAYFQDCLGWQSVYAYNTEILGPTGTLGRKSQKDVVLERYLRQALVSLNPGLPVDAYDDGVRQTIQTTASKSLLQTNLEKYDLLKNGVKVAFRNSKGEVEDRRLQLFDFQTPANNHFLVVRELWVQGSIYRRRPDIIGFVNGIPLLFMELKNIHKDIQRAYDDNVSDYKDTIPHVFHHNAMLILSNGRSALCRANTSIFTSGSGWRKISRAWCISKRCSKACVPKKISSISWKISSSLTTAPAN